MRPGTLPLLAAAAIAFVIAGWYVSIIAAQGAHDLRAPRVWLVAGYMAGGGAAALLGALGRRRRGYLGWAAMGALVFVGAIGILTIGAPLIIAAGLAAIGASRAGAAMAGGEGYSKATAFAVASLVILVGVAGLFATQPGLR